MTGENGIFIALAYAAAGLVLAAVTLQSLAAWKRARKDSGEEQDK